MDAVRAIGTIILIVVLLGVSVATLAQARPQINTKACDWLYDKGVAVLVRAENVNYVGMTAISNLANAYFHGYRACREKIR